MKAVLRFIRLLPARLELEHLRWARKEICPMHPDLPHVLNRISELEEVCN